MGQGLVLMGKGTLNLNVSTECIYTCSCCSTKHGGRERVHTYIQWLHWRWCNTSRVKAWVKLSLLINYANLKNLGREWNWNGIGFYNTMLITSNFNSMGVAYQFKATSTRNFNGAKSWAISNHITFHGVLLLFQRTCSAQYEQANN